MRPEDGWKRSWRLLDDPKRPYQDKLAVLGTLRFFQAYQPVDYRKPILIGMAAVVARGDMADMAVEDLRRWKWWDLTKHVLAQYNKPTHAAPLVKNAILRYALSCPDAGGGRVRQAVASDRGRPGSRRRASRWNSSGLRPRRNHDRIPHRLRPLTWPAG